MIISTILLILQAASPAAAPVEEAAKPEKMICKKSPQIGSLVRVKKVCRTAKGWKEAEELNRSSVNEMQRTSRAPPNG